MPKRIAVFGACLLFTTVARAQATDAVIKRPAVRVRWSTGASGRGMDSSAVRTDSMPNTCRGKRLVTRILAGATVGTVEGAVLYFVVQAAALGGAPHSLSEKFMGAGAVIGGGVIGAGAALHIGCRDIEPLPRPSPPG